MINATYECRLVVPRLHMVRIIEEKGELSAPPLWPVVDERGFQRDSSFSSSGSAWNKSATRP